MSKWKKLKGTLKREIEVYRQNIKEELNDCNYIDAAISDKQLDAYEFILLDLMVRIEEGNC